MASVAALMLATVTYFLLNQTDDSIAVEAGSEKVLTDPQHPVQVGHAETGFSFIDPEPGELLEEMSSTGSDSGEWVAITHTAADVPLMLNVRHGLPDRMDTGQWLRDAKVQANTPTDYSLKPGETAQRSEVVDLRGGTQIDPGDSRPQFASIFTPTTVVYVVHHPNSYDKKLNYYELWKDGNRVVVSESPVLFDSGLNPGTHYGYRITGSNTHPDEGFSGRADNFKASIYLRTPDSELDQLATESMPSYH